MAFAMIIFVEYKIICLKQCLTILLFFCFTRVYAQNTKDLPGIIIGTVLDLDNSRAISGATVTVSMIPDSAVKGFSVTVKDGAFLFDGLPFGYYRLQVSSAGYTGLIIDSIYLRKERFDFDLNDIRLGKKATLLNEVIVYAEKPLIESKDGKIIFNTGESALSSAATTNELLKQTPLVNVDNDGKVLLRGKEVKILIDDKPVELNVKQLQDLLESMPGSMIDKIEVMTTPPPQYANERGGVINIVTKKGKVGFNARINFNYGTRGEAGINGNLGYRKNKLAINFSAGFGYNEYRGSSYSNRQNIYIDSLSYFNATGQNNSDNRRPNGRLSIDYELNKRNILNFTSQYNANDAGSKSGNEYSNINNYNLLYKLSRRNIVNSTNSRNPNFNFTYTYKGKNPKEIFKLITGFNFNAGNYERDYYQQYLNPDYTFTGTDSTQEQNTVIKSRTISIRLNYELPLKDNKTSLNFGANFSRLNSHNVLNTAFMKKPENIFVENDLLSNNFRFHQTIYALRTAMRYDFIPGFFYINGGVQAEHTQTNFEIKNGSSDYLNNYWTALPFATLIRKWKNEVSLTFSYKRTIQRPGLTELNPSVDYADPYNTRYGNPYLLPYHADNFDLIIGKWNKLFYVNGSVGYNALQNIYSSIRTLQPDGKTNTTWQNISGRQEYETSVWGGLTPNKKAKVNISLGYTYNLYSLHDREQRYFRNGGSFYSTVNGSYQFSDLMNANVNLSFNRFANPQGTINNTLSMNMGIQRKFFAKKIIVACNIIDPFRQQQNKVFTYGSNFNLESFSTTYTRNFRIALSYVFNKNLKKNNKLQLLKKGIQNNERQTGLEPATSSLGNWCSTR